MSKRSVRDEKRRLEADIRTLLDGKRAQLESQMCEAGFESSDVFLLPRQIATRLRPDLYFEGLRAETAKTKAAPWPATAQVRARIPRASIARLRRVASEVERVVIPLLRELQRQIPLTIPTSMAADMRALADTLDMLRSFGRPPGRPVEKDERNSRVMALVVQFRERTGRPHHPLVAALVNLSYRDNTEFFADDVKKIELLYKRHDMERDREERKEQKRDRNRIKRREREPNRSKR